MSVLDVFATFDTALEDGDGNTIGLLLTDPNGVKYSSGVALPVLDAPSREVVVKNPAAGQWLLEVRGVRGLAAVPDASLPTSGAAAPGPVEIKITQQLFTLEPIGDIQGHAAQAQIETVLKNRQMDTFADGSFRPDANVTREDFARLLYLNTPLRQSPSATPKYTDVSAELAPIAEAVTANGSTLRDWNFAPAGMVAGGRLDLQPAGRRDTARHGGRARPRARPRRRGEGEGRLDRHGELQRPVASRSPTTPRFPRRCAATCRSRSTRGCCKPSSP